MEISWCKNTTEWVLYILRQTQLLETSDAFVFSSVSDINEISVANTFVRLLINVFVQFDCTFFSWHLNGPFKYTKRKQNYVKFIYMYLTQNTQEQHDKEHICELKSFKTEFVQFIFVNIFHLMCARVCKQRTSGSNNGAPSARYMRVYAIIGAH